jgi:hypothetical protein
MLKTSIDELTIVLQATVSEKLALENNNDWQKLANKIIKEFEKKADLVAILGDQQEEQNCPQGYNVGKKYGDHSFYFCVAYNKENYQMGIIVKFSAQALAYYLKSANQQVYEFLQGLKSDKYEFRLSRCDVDVDFLNEKVTPTRIFNDLKNEKVLIYYQKKNKDKLTFVRKNCKLQGFAINREVPTCYLGAVSSDCQLKIYDKKLEQIERNGSKLDYVLQFDSVIRFEIALKHELAHNLTDLLLNIHTDKELNDLILSVFLQKFYFKRATTGNPTPYTRKMEQALKGKKSYLLGHLNVDNDLLKRFQYLLYSSGTISTLFKVLSLWGIDDLDEATDFIKQFVLDWSPNDGCRAWLKKHGSDTAESFTDFADLKKNLQRN